MGNSTEVNFYRRRKNKENQTEDTRRRISQTTEDNKTHPYFLDVSTASLPGVLGGTRAGSENTVLDAKLYR
jgi:hypothetical protein